MKRSVMKNTVDSFVLPKRLLRVFPRRTKATPDDINVRVGAPKYPLLEDCDEVHVSVAFGNDREKAEQIAEQWQVVTRNVKIGGPAYGDKGGEFTPGMYLKAGYTITSRGCPNNCWFCSAWKTEGRLIRTLPIVDGWIVADNNLLACPTDHTEKVFDMLDRQPQAISFTGGLEAARLESWHVDRLARLRLKSAWFAYDEPSDWEPLVAASRLLRSAGMVGSHNNKIGCYVLVGHPKDTLASAVRRLRAVMRLGFYTQAMLYDEGVHWDKAEQKVWKKLRRVYTNPVIMFSKFRKLAALGENAGHQARR